MKSAALVPVSVTTDPPGAVIDAVYTRFPARIWPACADGVVMHPPALPASGGSTTLASVFVPCTDPDGLTMSNVELNAVIGPRNWPGEPGISSVCAPIVTEPVSVNVPAYGPVAWPETLNV